MAFNQVLMTIPVDIAPECLEVALMNAYRKRIIRLECDYHPSARVIWAALERGESVTPMLLRCANRIVCTIEFFTGMGAHINYRFGKIPTLPYGVVLYERGSGGIQVIKTVENLKWDGVIDQLRRVAGV